MTRALLAIVFGLALSSLASGCKQQSPEPKAQASGSAASHAPMASTLDAAIGSTAQLSTMAEAIRQTGLGGVLRGKANYTLFAPTNAAFEKLGQSGRGLRQPEQRAAFAALLREHIVPGMLTADDLEKALARSPGKPLKLRSMGKGTLTVSRDGGIVTVTGPDGAKATLTSASAIARNGSVIGIDGVLRKLG